MFHSNTKVALTDNPSSNYNDSVCLLFKANMSKSSPDNMASQFLQAILKSLFKTQLIPFHPY